MTVYETVSFGNENENEMVETGGGGDVPNPRPFLLTSAADVSFISTSAMFIAVVVVVAVIEE
jgi:hypothetical protein